MGNPRKSYDNRGPIEYSSIASPLVYGDSDANPPIPWIHVVSAGSGGLVVKSENGTSRTYTGLVAGRTLYGPFKEITSMTLGKILIGDGPAPENTLSVAAPASTGALGSVELTTAPVSADTPIAVSNTDKRVTTIESLVSFSGSDGSLTEQPFPHPAFACTLVGVSVEAPAAAAASDTNYVTITFAKRDGAGGSATTLVAGTTQVTGGVNSGSGLLAFQHVSLGTPSATAVAATDVLTIKSVKTSAGVAIGPSIVRMTFTVP